jgi:hypothetical protein
MVMSADETDLSPALWAGIEIAMAEDLRKKRAKKKTRRNKSGLITKTPIKIMKAEDFDNLVNHNTLYKNILIAYVKIGFYEGLPVNEQLSLYDIQRFYKRFTIVKKSGSKLNVVARTKTEAIETSKTPKRDITHIIRANRDGKASYLKVGVPKC